MVTTFTVYRPPRQVTEQWLGRPRVLRRRMVYRIPENVLEAARGAAMSRP